MVSIIIPFHHSVGLLNEVIDNLCEGIDPSLFEIIVVNDGSCYPTGGFAPLKIGKPNMKVINTPVQRGVGYSFDRGIEKATGETIVLMGADVFPRQRSWIGDVSNAVMSHPNTIGCSVCIGLTPDDHNLDRKGHSTYYGADLLTTVSPEDLPENSQKLKENPDYRAIFEGKWRTTKDKNVPYHIPCALGAFYFTSKRYYNEIGGWDTTAGQRFQGHMYWGGLEPHISLKSWLYGGGVTLFPNIEAGHVFGRVSKENQNEHRSRRSDMFHWNKLWIAETLIFDDRLREQIISHLPDSLNLNKAKKYIRQHYSAVLAKRRENESKCVMKSMF